MPYVWAKNFSKLDDLSISTSNMFYPAGLKLSRKEQLGIIWLAANYDPEKYKKIIPPRECEKANIERICNAIMNPAMPFALRLSAQLLLGTVRVYRTQVRLILQMAEQMIVKLSTLISESCTRPYIMPVAMLRADAITIADTGMSIIDYSLEPVYYDPQMIMHMNEDDFIAVNGTPLHSPIKLEKKRKKSNITPTKSPIVVSNSKISFQEDLLSPSRPIQVPPGEDEFGILGFGPAEDNFLADLLEIADIKLRPKTLNFGPDDEEEEPLGLPPLMEDDENILDTKEVEKPFDVISRKRKLEDLDDTNSLASDTPGQIADLDQLLKDAIGINAALSSNLEDIIKKTTDEECHEGIEKVEDIYEVAKDVAKEVGKVFDEEISKEVEGDVEGEVREELGKEVDEQVNEQVGKEVEKEVEKEVGKEFGKEVDEQDDHQAGIESVEKEIVDDSTFVIQPVDGKTVVRSLSESSVDGVPGVPMDWETNLRTPADAIVLKPLPSQPKKKRKLMVDKEIFIDSKEMKNNFAAPEKLIRMPMIAGSALPSGKDLFSLPIKETNLRRVKYWWENNTVREEGDPIAVILPQDIIPDFEEAPSSVGPPSVGPPSVASTEILIDESMDEDIIKEMEAPETKEDQHTVATVEEREIVPDDVSQKSPERTSVSRYDETPSGSIPIFRDGSTGLKSLDQSGGSTTAIHQTPVGELSAISMDQIHGDDEMLAEFPPSPRISNIGVLPRDADIDLEEVPELDIVMEQEERYIDFIADMTEDNDILNHNFKSFQSTIFHSLETSNETVFQRLFPSSRTKRRDAALALYLTLNMHKNGYVELQQTELFGEIRIHKGRVS